MGRVDAYIDEDVESFDFRDVHRYETAMCVVDKQVTAQSPSGVVIYAASPIGDISHNESLRAWAEASQDVGDGCGEEEQTLWKLESYLSRA